MYLVRWTLASILQISVPFSPVCLHILHLLVFLSWNLISPDPIHEFLLGYF